MCNKFNLTNIYYNCLQENAIYACHSCVIKSRPEEENLDYFVLEVCPLSLSLSHVNWLFSFINWNKGPIYGPTGISFLWVGIYILLKCVGVLIKLKCIKNKFLYQRKNRRKKKRKNLSMVCVKLSHNFFFSFSV